MLAAIWFAAGARKLVTGYVPSVVMISMVVLTVQTVAQAVMSLRCHDQLMEGVAPWSASCLRAKI
jgi:hypothetical protein